MFPRDLDSGGEREQRLDHLKVFAIESLHGDDYSSSRGGFFHSPFKGIYLLKSELYLWRILKGVT